MIIARDPLQLLLRKLETHSVLHEADRQAISCLPFKPRTLDAATFLIREGDPPTHCSVLLSGFAYRQKLAGNGMRQIVAIHIPGEPIDFQNLFLDVSDHSVQMLTRGEVALVPRAPLQALARSRAAIAHAILVIILVEASILREWLLNIGQRDARTRIAHLLCEFAIRLDAQGLSPDHAYELPITQDQLADAVGMTNVHVNRILRALQAEGLITRNRRAISFPDWERMREVGDFNERYLHLQPQMAGTEA
jgi:CRP-like cAMP-binding protein